MHAHIGTYLHNTNPYRVTLNFKDGKKERKVLILNTDENAFIHLGSKDIYYKTPTI